MKILLHVCCGPCTAYPLKTLRENGYEVNGYFFNPNIHPFKEFRRRVVALETFCSLESFNVSYHQKYGLKEYLRKVVLNEHKRCPICYLMRLQSTVKKALEDGADAFSTTLLYSRYQDHALIRSLAEKLATENGIPFYYQDFREGWQEGINTSKEMDLYRQPYCGCIYSEQERYDKSLRKKKINTQKLPNITQL